MWRPKGTFITHRTTKYSEELARAKTFCLKSALPAEESTAPASFTSLVKPSEYPGCDIRIFLRGKTGNETTLNSLFVSASGERELVTRYYALVMDKHCHVAYLDHDIKYLSNLWKHLEATIKKERSKSGR